MNSNEPLHTGITRFVIAGHGLEAWLTANHLLAAFGGRRIEIKVCPVPGSDDYDDFYSVWPMGMDNGLDPIKVPIKALVQECRGSFSLGFRYGDLFRPYGTIGLDFLGTPFHHHWLRAFAKEPASGYFDWSPATIAVNHDRFAPPVSQNAIGSLQHGMAMHIDTALLTAMLRERALRNGAHESGSALSAVQRENSGDRIKWLETRNGEKLTAELYLDCSGPQRSLVSESAADQWRSAPGLDNYAVSIKKEPSQNAPPSFHQVTPVANGWQLDIPGNGWCVALTVESSTDETNGKTITPGYSEKPWVENCVAIGMASSSLLPLEAVHTRFLATSVKRLVDHMPGVDCDPRETVEYNKLAITDLAEILDLTAAYEHFRRQGMVSAPGALHDSLKKRIDLFEQRGWVSPPDSSFFEPGDWVASFMQLGLVPARPDRLAGRIPKETLEEYLKSLKARIMKTAMDFPPLQQFRAPQA